jgi:hypothetical protein
LGYSPSAAAKNSAGVVIRTVGEPSRSRVRAAAASISRVGPPPPSPQPNGTSDVLARPFSAYWRWARASSAAESSEL